MEKEKIEKGEIELVIMEGKMFKPSSNEGTVMDDMQEQDVGLLERINKKLDLLLAAQDIN